jgi:hypothetical protein
MKTLVLLSSTLLFEYAAPVAGIALDMPPGLILVTVILVALGVLYFQFSLFDAMNARSAKVAGFLDLTRKKYGSSAFIRHYGIFALVPAMLVVGFYVCPAISWLLGWNRKCSLLLMMVTFSIASILVLIVGTGVFRYTAG